MNIKSTVNSVLTKYPWLHTLRGIMREYCSLLSFLYHMMFHKPYFGAYMMSNQVWPERAPFMRKLMHRVCSEYRDILVLEIGSWAGESAVLWANAAKQAGNHGTIRIICVDPWTLYPSLITNPRLIAMSKSARGDRIFPLFNHNVKWSGHSDVIIPVRTFSQVAARFFREKQFDIVFIDGDHTYNSVSFDIQNYAPLVKDDGYICGDDLEIQANQVNESFTREHLEDDVVCDPTTGIYFHPSITVAVGEYFGEVSVYAGFWVMQKWANNWRKVDIH